MDRDEVRTLPRSSPSARFLTLLAVSAGLWCSGEAAGQAPVQRVRDFTESASGFQLLGEIHTGVLSGGQAQGVTLPLVEGSDYMVVGFCDTGCSNLDLTLFDPAGGEIQADRLPDAEPMLAFTPEISGLFHIQADMMDCSVSLCRVAIGVLGSSQEPGVPPGEDMAGRLNLFAADLSAFGFIQIGEPRRGALNTNQAVRVPIPLESGQEYRIVGVCDVDCFDLDLVLWDDQGGQVAADFLEDDVPVLALMADTAGTFDLEVGMVDCGLEPCGFQVAVYAKGDKIGPGGTALSGELKFFETHEGILDSRNAPEGEGPSDLYEIRLEAGQRLIVDLRSEDFDTLLRITDPEGGQEENDDYGSEPGHSHLEILATASGVYQIRALSFTPEAQGDYILQVAIVQ